TATKKGRPRKSAQWPPPEDQRGAKSVYARNWYAQSSGTQADFEAHYKTLTPSERR
ncbi:hypothetical protein BD310DRAFT_764105, partial [Dichomitus squalens]